MEIHETDRLMKEIHDDAVAKFGEKEYGEALDRARLKREFARILREQRKAMKIDQTELARRACISQQQLSSYEKGRTSPSMERMMELFKVLGLSIVIENREGEILVRV